ncbi:MAG: hypothetical protein RSD47_00785 [Romboutsia sp.]
MEINKLKEEINRQKELNIKLFNSIPTPTREDPNNKKAEPILKQWREGSKKIKELLKELQVLELKNKKATEEKNKNKVFVNSYGEATNREITSISYQRNEKKLSNDILKFIS